MKLITKVIDSILYFTVSFFTWWLMWIFIFKMSRDDIQSETFKVLDFKDVYSI